MSDNKNEKTPRDAQRINIHEDYEVQYWTKALNITKEQLAATVGKVGVMVEDVKRALGHKTTKAS